MKVNGFDKVVILQLSALIEAASDNEKQVQPFHRKLLAMRDMDDATLHEFVANEVSPLMVEGEVTDPVGYRTMGFAQYGDETGGNFALWIPGTKAFVLQVEKRERVLPGVSVRNAVAKRMEAHRAKEIEGWTPTRKDWAQMKEEVEAEMLKHAPIRPSRVNVIVSAPYVFVFTSSAKTSEEVSAVIRSAFGTWPVEKGLVNEFSLRQSMANIVRGNVDGITGETYIHIKHDDGDDLKLKEIDVQGDEVVLDYLTRHFTVRALDLKIDAGLSRVGVGDVFFRLIDKGILTGLHVGDADVDANYDATLDLYNNDSGQFLTYMANLFQIVLSLDDIIDAMRVYLDAVQPIYVPTDDDDEV